MDVVQISDAERAELQQLHLQLPHLRHWPFSRILATPTVLGCLRNVLAARASCRPAPIPAPEEFELT